MARLKLRNSEWILIAFFAYVAALVPFFPQRPRLSFQPLIVLLIVTLLLGALARIESFSQRVISITRDWLPLALTLAAFREMELFITPNYNHRYELAWMRWDDIFLREWGLLHAVESLGPLIPFFLELCYLLVYGLGAYCVAVVWLRAGRERIDRFYVIYLVGTLLSYALIPYFPTQPPRIAFAGLDTPNYSTVLRSTNLFLLRNATIHVGVFPSAHVSSAFSAAWGLFLLLPKHKRTAWLVLIYAVCVSTATVYGRYHYGSDVIAGFGVSLIAAAVAFVFRLHDRQTAFRESEAARNFSAY